MEARNDDDYNDDDDDDGPLLPEFKSMNDLCYEQSFSFSFV